MKVVTSTYKGQPVNFVNGIIFNDTSDLRTVEKLFDEQGIRYRTVREDSIVVDHFAELENLSLVYNFKIGQIATFDF